MVGLSDGAAGVSVYITVPDQAAAEALGRTLVQEGLAACVNILPGLHSIYRWQGELHDDEEVLLLAKTRAELGRRVCERVAELHDAEVPCAVVLPWVEALPSYARWVAEQTGGGDGAQGA